MEEERGEISEEERRSYAAADLMSFAAKIPMPHPDNSVTCSDVFFERCKIKGECRDVSRDPDSERELVGKCSLWEQYRSVRDAAQAVLSEWSQDPRRPGAPPSDGRQRDGSRPVGAYLGVESCDLWSIETLLEKLAAFSTGGYRHFTTIDDGEVHLQVYLLKNELITFTLNNREEIPAQFLDVLEGTSLNVVVSVEEALIRKYFKRVVLAEFPDARACRIEFFKDIDRNCFVLDFIVEIKD